MEPVNVLLTFVTGVGLRLVVPLVGTAVVVWLLQQLDKRWQAEAELQWKLVPVAAQRTPCWEARNCSAARRASCAAFAHPETPCWQTFRDDRGQMKESCLDCEVFRTAPLPA